MYRVHHAISLEVEGNETTLLPSEDWVEREVLKSGTGWIDVHKECLVRVFQQALLLNVVNGGCSSLCWPVFLKIQSSEQFITICLNNFRTRWQFVAHAFCV